MLADPVVFATDTFDITDAQLLEYAATCRCSSYLDRYLTHRLTRDSVESADAAFGGCLLWHLAALHHWPLVRVCIRLGANPWGVPPVVGETLFDFIASQRSTSAHRESALRDLFRRALDVQVGGTNGPWPLMHYALHHLNDSAAHVMLLLQRGADANTCCSHAGCLSPLQTAIVKHDDALVQLLVQQGRADINVSVHKWSSMTLAHWALERLFSPVLSNLTDKCWSIVRYLLIAGSELGQSQKELAAQFQQHRHWEQTCAVVALALRQQQAHLRQILERWLWGDVCKVVFDYESRLVHSDWTEYAQQLEYCV